MLEQPTKSVVIIEDDSELRVLLRDFFNHQGYRVIAPTNFAKVVEAIETSKPNLVLCDINLPGFNGLELLKQCVVCAPRVPFVVMTAFDQTSDYKQRASKEGAAACWDKTCGLKSLTQLLSELASKGIN